LTGQQGATGAAGPAGADSTVVGPTGADGADGATGSTGPAGADGSDASVTKANVEAVLTGAITSHTHAVGASELTDLDDVTLTSVANNDLLMYNSVASKWQNTNLGVSVTPTLTGVAIGLVGLPYVITVSNHATYDDPAYFVEVYDGTTLTVANSAVTDNQDGTLTFAAPAAGTHEIRVICQDFGDLQSEIATKEIGTEDFGGTYRYWKLAEFTDSNDTFGRVMTANIRVYTGSGATGTEYPPEMTSAVLPTPYVVTSSFYYNDYYGDWKAFDYNATNTVWWTLGTQNALIDEWIKIDLGSSRSISSLKYQQGQHGYQVGGCTVYASTDDTNWDNMGVLTLNKSAASGTTTIIG
jgi:hypothetical protein